MTMPGPAWHLEVFATNNGFEPFTAFQDSLTDTATVALDAALTHVLAVRGIELVRTEWRKPLGDGLHEFRVRHTADEIRRMFGDEAPGVAPPHGESVLLRVFAHFHGQRIVLLLSGYDKQRDPSTRTQQKEIKYAQKKSQSLEGTRDQAQGREAQGPAQRGVSPWKTEQLNSTFVQRSTPLLTAYGIKHISRIMVRNTYPASCRRRVPAVARSYEVAAASRLARLSPAAGRQGRVFEEAYDVAVQLMEMRQRRGMTQLQLAEATGIAQSEISRIERGGANPTEKTIHRLADALGAELKIVERDPSVTVE